MKLMLCYSCCDLFKLDRELRQCKCGKVKGRYEEDGHRAVTNGKGACLGLGNGSLQHSISTGEPHPDLDSGRFDEYNRVLCWIRPHDGEKNPRSRIDENL